VKPVNKARGQDVVNRSAGLSQQQLATLAIVQRLGKPRTVEILRALHGPSFDRREDSAGYARAFASMSRTLSRLWVRELVDLWRPQICCQGDGGWWTITTKGREALASKPPTCGACLSRDEPR
jgi:hypothetical protein